MTLEHSTNLQVDNTDAEGRLILADALCYADTLSPRLVSFTFSSRLISCVI